MGRPASPRLVEPELLDALPVEDARAIASRGDLVRVNAVMFQGAIMAGLMRNNLDHKPLRILELGAGDGRFMLSVARKLGRSWADVELVTLDMADLMTPKVRADFRALGWRVEPVVADVFDWIGRPQPGRFDAVTANLFLHHFQEGQLRDLLAAMAGVTSCFLATEPRRSDLALWGTGWLRALGVNEVTLHDAAASVRAGFSERELSSLWPEQSAMTLEERRIGPFTHAFAARAAKR